MRIDTKMASGDSSLLRFLRIRRGIGGIRRSRLRDERGQSLVEFALVLPILLLLVVGIIKFGIALNNYITLTNSAAMAAQLIASETGNTSIDPCNAAMLAVDNAAPFLNPKSIGYNITVSAVGSASATTLASGSSPSCNTSADYSVITQGNTVNVQLTYPCNLNFLGFNFTGGNCLLTAGNSELIQ